MQTYLLFFLLIVDFFTSLLRTDLLYFDPFCNAWYLSDIHLRCVDAGQVRAHATDTFTRVFCDPSVVRFEPWDCQFSVSANKHSIGEPNGWLSMSLALHLPHAQVSRVTERFQVA